MQHNERSWIPENLAMFKFSSILCAAQPLRVAGYQSVNVRAKPNTNIESTRHPAPSLSCSLAKCCSACLAARPMEMMTRTLRNWLDTEPATTARQKWSDWKDEPSHIEKKLGTHFLPDTIWADSTTTLKNVRRGQSLHDTAWPDCPTVGRRVARARKGQASRPEQLTTYPAVTSSCIKIGCSLSVDAIHPYPDGRSSAMKFDQHDI